MDKQTRSWAKANGFKWQHSIWLRDDGCAIVWATGSYAVMTSGGGFHPTCQPPMFMEQVQISKDIVAEILNEERANVRN